ncbi:MAG: MerR family transcriptional regulator [Lawsonibacter sp.]|jgi:DNA-binding transcriptional MerR regulator|nr:MerR family transcriptional regulator [Lawsonibacter sp.]MCI8990405.1 MerR family transcriptional regulator [Lawsonibacter sp.]MCI9267526.1 MerR family transcriptional regulator [Lawsonibacter sp.]
MEYTIQALSRLSGVTTRALRWYDKIGLLTPSGRTEGNYRLYGPAEVDRLQDILYYRALGVELAQVKRILDDPSYNRLAVLRSHLAALEAERERVQGLINSVKETILTQERDEIMIDEKKFEAFKRGALEEYRKTYEAESREQYGDVEVDAMLTRLQGVTQEQYAEWESLGREILEKLSAAVTAGTDPAGEVGKELAALHQRWLTVTGNQYDVQRHRGLAELYVQDERFTAYYDREVPGCARFLRDAVLHWIA